MRFRVDRFQRARFWLTARAVSLLGLGGLGVVLGSFLTLMGVLMIATSDESLYGRGPYFVLTAFGGVLPLALGAFFLVRGVARWQILRRLRELSALAARSPSLSAGEVAQGLGVSAERAAESVLEAAEAGLVEDDEADAPAPIVPPATPAVSGVRRTRLGRSPGDAASCVGAVLNDTYRLEAHLGAGGMGTVYAARHLRTGRAQAVKMILPEARADGDAGRRFEREATAAGGLGHPHIVAVHDYDVTEDGVRYLVMDLLRGETLEQRLAREGSLPFAEARRVALEIASALAAAHAVGLLHRDIKPANVFLVALPAAPPRAVLLDFGLVKRLDEAAASRLTTTGAAVGTPLYMSPEQARGEALDVRSDVYGLCALLYEMSTGAPPFADRTLAGVYARLLTESAPRASSLHDVPPGLDAFLDRGLAKRREDRFADTRAFAEALVHVGPLAA
jgi:serine/threonine-protein kinase